MRLLAFVLCCFIGIPAPAQVPSRWDRLSETPKTQEVKVYLRDGKVLKGSIQETTPDGPTFVEGQNVIRVNRDEIGRITVKSRPRGALVGGLAFCGGIVGAITGGIGAAVGSEKTLYAAEQKASPAPAAASK